MVVQVPLVDFSKTIRLADIPHYYAPDENSGLAAEGLIWFAEHASDHIHPCQWSWRKNAV